MQRIIAHELGVPASSVHSIAQPSDYHLDVKMLPIAPSEMIVNDSFASCERQVEWRCVVGLCGRIGHNSLPLRNVTSLPRR